MHVLLSFLGTMAALVATSAAADHGRSGHRARHFPAANGQARALDVHLDRRATSGEFTYYVTGLGACGKTNAPSDFIVAVNSAQFAGGKHCFESITITVNGKTAQAQIVDECPSCAPGGVDFSQGLFEYFAPTSVGVLQGSWSFGSEPTTTSTTHSPTPTTTSTSTTPTSTWTPTTTSTHVEPSTSSTPKPTTTKSKETPSATSSAAPSTSSLAPTTSELPSSSSLPTSTGPAAAAAESGTASSASSGDLDDLNQVLLQLSNLVVQGAGTR